ncbi:hypothetical protein BGX24_011611 [Mortierella sp. AD032]|nr:hypothetical protein BGX24_011611 [Mortierella sp. AD032]
MIQRYSGGLQSFVCDLDDCDYGEEYFGFGQESAKAILEHVSTLEVFRVEDSYLKSSQIQQLLCTAPRLKEFNILSGDCDGGSQGLEAMDVVATDWGSSRPDIVRTICGGPSSDYTLEGTIQESINIQRQEMDIYRDKEAAWAKQHYWPLAEILTTDFTLYKGDASEFDASSDEFANDEDYDDYRD